jgi:protein-disulfide isomerase
MRPNFLLLSGLIAGGVSMMSCQPVQDENVNKKLDEINKKLDALDKKVGAGGMANQQRPQPPPGPDPNAVYAVAIDGAAVSGPKSAKVTIVEAFEFA